MKSQDSIGIVTTGQKESRQDRKNQDRIGRVKTGYEESRQDRELDKKVKKTVKVL